MEMICMLALAKDPKGEAQMIAVHPEKLMVVIPPEAATPEMTAMAAKSQANGVEVLGFLVDNSEG